VVLTRGITDGAKASKLIADLSSIIYQHNVMQPRSSATMQ